jgi:hypothetical protein
VTDITDLYRRWIDELWCGHAVAADLASENFVGHWPDRDVHGPQQLQAIIDETRGMLRGLTFRIEVGPIVDGDLVAGRWTGQGRTDEGTMSFFGNDILRVVDGKFVEYWPASSAGS